MRALTSSGEEGRELVGELRARTGAREGSDIVEVQCRRGGTCTQLPICHPGAHSSAAIEPLSP